MLAPVIHQVIQDALAAETISGVAKYPVTQTLQEGESYTYAVFTGGLPEDAILPAIVINEITSSPFGTRGKRGGEFSLDVQVIENKSRSSAAARDIAAELWQLLDRNTLDALALFTFGDYVYDLVACIADPPVKTAGEWGFPGYTIRVRVIVMEAE